MWLYNSVILLRDSLKDRRARKYKIPVLCWEFQVDLTGNLQFRHKLYFLFVAFFSNITLISIYFKFSRHVTGPFVDPFVDHLTIFVLKTQGSSVIFCPCATCVETHTWILPGFRFVSRTCHESLSTIHQQYNAGRRTDFGDQKSSDFSGEIFLERFFWRSITDRTTLFPLISCGVDSFSPN